MHTSTECIIGTKLMIGKITKSFMSYKMAFHIKIDLKILLILDLTRWATCTVSAGVHQGNFKWLNILAYGLISGS